MPLTPFQNADAIFDPGQFSKESLMPDGSYQDTSLSSQGTVTQNPLDFLTNLFGGNPLSANQSLGDNNFGQGVTNTSGYPNTSATGSTVDYSYGSPVTSTPTYNPNTGTSRTLPTFTNPFSSGSSSDYPSLNSSTTSGLFGNSFESAPAYNDFFDSNSYDLGFGASFNPGALNFGNSYSQGWKEGGRLLDLGNTSLGGLGAKELGLSGSQYRNAKQGLGMLGQFTGNEGLNKGLGLASLTGNRAWDMATKGTALQYLNDPLSARSITGGVMNRAGLGNFMPALDYLQGYNTKGGLLGMGISAIHPLAGAMFNMFSPSPGTYNKDGSYNSIYNSFYDGKEGSALAMKYGMKPGEQYDIITNQNRDLFDSWEDELQFTDTEGYNKYMQEKAASMTEYEKNNAPFGEEGDDTWSPGGGSIMHGGGYNWNNSQDEAVAESNNAATNYSFDTDTGEMNASAGGYTWDADLGSAAEMQEETGVGTTEWDSTSEDFSWGGDDDDGLSGTSDFDEDDADAGGWSFDDSASDSGGDSGGGGGSYIATAATQALGEEGLTIFEEWRDYMSSWHPTFKTSYGRYRVTAPKIVKAIDNKKNSTDIYNYIWDIHLKPIFDLIREDKDSGKALNDYKIMVKELQNKFLKEKA